MPNKEKNSTLALHAALAHEIKSAKKQMFKRHREGVPLWAAANQFKVDITERLDRIAPKENGAARGLESVTNVTPATESQELNHLGVVPQISDEPLDTSETAPMGVISTMVEKPGMTPIGAKDRMGTTGPQRAVRVPIIGTVGDDGIKLFDEEREEARVNLEVDNVLRFFDSQSPDFISSEVVYAIDLACNHFGIDQPTYDDDPLTGETQTRAILTKLFAKTKLFHLPDDDDDDSVEATLLNGKKIDLYGDAADLAREPSDTHPDWLRLADAVAEICSNGATPADLKNSVLDFLHSNSGDIWGKLIVTPPMIVKILVHAASTDDDMEVSQ
ncbi:MAG: hypothetical protein ACR2HX_19460 [Pyrinomonadaceae bacterium]